MPRTHEPACGGRVVARMAVVAPVVIAMSIPRSYGLCSWLVLCGGSGLLFACLFHTADVTACPDMEPSSGTAEAITTLQLTNCSAAHFGLNGDPCVNIDPACDDSSDLCRDGCECSGKQCGGDGCGGSCGSCGIGDECGKPVRQDIVCTVIKLSGRYRLYWRYLRVRPTMHR